MSKKDELSKRFNITTSNDGDHVLQVDLPVFTVVQKRFNNLRDGAPTRIAVFLEKGPGEAIQLGALNFATTVDGKPVFLYVGNYPLTGGTFPMTKEMIRGETDKSEVCFNTCVLELDLISDELADYLLNMEVNQVAVKLKREAEQKSVDRALTVLAAMQNVKESIQALEVSLHETLRAAEQLDNIRATLLVNFGPEGKGICGVKVDPKDMSTHDLMYRVLVAITKDKKLE